ncbi:MAG: TetR/AcrR family transcriptional regulator [Faecalibacterium sp.]|jgi:AcrR family transcriptional regulator|nr:TetR/AcrR family transcriptional regulator [Faecalibacterium sp.]
MAKRDVHNTRGRMIEAAWKLFYERGYEETTVDAIIEASGTSKGSFYHYFDGKDALLSELSYLFDEKYNALAPTLDPAQNSFEALMYLNRELFTMIDDSISMELLARLYSSQLVTRGEKHLLDRKRTYFKLLRQIVLRGQEKGELRRDIPAAEIVKRYALCERALIYDWCLSNGEYSLAAYAREIMPAFLSHLKTQQG